MALQSPSWFPVGRRPTFPAVGVRCSGGPPGRFHVEHRWSSARTETPTSCGRALCDRPRWMAAAPLHESALGRPPGVPRETRRAGARRAARRPPCPNDPTHTHGGAGSRHARHVEPGRRVARPTEHLTSPAGPARMRRVVPAKRQTAPGDAAADLPLHCGRSRVVRSRPVVAAPSVSRGTPGSAGMLAFAPGVRTGWAT